MFDFIGDIHGHADQLHVLFRKLGYIQLNGVYRHPDRKAFFLGDYVNRGSQVRSVLEIVRVMVEEGEAFAVLGNHEYNLVAYLTNNSEGKPLRAHSEANFRQLKDTFSSFGSNRSELYEYKDWIQTLPLFFENHRFRVVHACWDDRHVSFIKNHYPVNRLTESLLQASVIPGKPEYDAVQVLLKGIEIQLSGDEAWVDADGNSRNSVRLRWWENPRGKRLSDLAIREIQSFKTFKGEKYMSLFPGYDIDAPPLFIGHYCLDGNPRLLRSNICCTDYCVYRSQRIVAYRWNGERTLSEDNFYTSD
jgi:hypothetical protein